jgi:hypothetical protein
MQFLDGCGRFYFERKSHPHAVALPATSLRAVPKAPSQTSSTPSGSQPAHKVFSLNSLHRGQTLQFISPESLSFNQAMSVRAPNSKPQPKLRESRAAKRTPSQVIIFQILGFKFLKTT